jgi:hypothetical protein
MKKINSTKIFDIFTLTHQELDTLMEDQSSETPYIIEFKNIIKGIENFYMIDIIYKKRIGEEYLSRRENIKLMYFTGLMKYLERVGEIKGDTLLEVERELGKKPLLFALKEMIQVFILVEDYEKCSVLQKYLDFFSLKKLDN